MMLPASPDLMTLVAIVCLKHLPKVLHDVTVSQGKMPGTTPTLLPETLRQIVNAKRLFVRFEQKHYEADDQEKASLTALCDWLADKAAVFSRNPAPVNVQWKPEQFTCKTPLPADAFEQIVEHVKLGRIG